MGRRARVLVRAGAPGTCAGFPMVRSVVVFPWCVPPKECCFLSIRGRHERISTRDFPPAPAVGSSGELDEQANVSGGGRIDDPESAIHRSESKKTTVRVGITSSEMTG